MRRRRRPLWPLVMLAVCVLAVTLAEPLTSSAFTSADMGRDVSFGTADDGSAFVRMDISNSIGILGSWDLVTVHNDLMHGIWVTVTLHKGGQGANFGDLVAPDGTLGDTATYYVPALGSVTVVCQPAFTFRRKTIKFDVDVESSGFTASLDDRSVRVWLW